MGADSSAENTQIPQIYLPKPKSLEFQERKASLGIHSPRKLELDFLTNPLDNFTNEK